MIVTVDGLSFVNTLLPGSGIIEASNHYLKTALEDINLSLPDTTITDFAWSRDAADTAETVETLRTFLKTKYKEAQTGNKRFIIVAHSWGTVLSYLALSSQSMQVDEIERVYVDLYITLGSPLGTDNAHEGFNYPEETTVITYTTGWTGQYSFCETCLPLADTWINYWAWGDVISGPFDGFMPFSSRQDWDDMQIDSSQAVNGYIGRNTSTTVNWHIYDSLMPGGLIDNQPLLDEVKQQIEGNDYGPDLPPFGGFDTPLEGAVARGSIPVTGWALDERLVQDVKIYREPVSGEGSGLVYIGDASFVEGARPDVAAAYPDHPNNTRAGWGYMMLTNFLPGKGNGTVVLHAVATDNGGHTVTLGTRTIVCDNTNAVKPFGAIDTPTQGGTASGNNFINWGWALTPQPNKIPENGSTINVYVDSIKIGNPTYNIYREDIATYFPGYANSNGAVGYFYLDATAYDNGVHSIHWTATDDAGNTDGIGSRYFTVSNSGRRDAAEAAASVFSDQYSVFSEKPADRLTPVRIKRGFEKGDRQEIYPDINGDITIELKQMERVVIDLTGGGSTNSTFKIHNSKLPTGSTLDRGAFHWWPGPAFYGTHRFEFINIERNVKRKIRIVIHN